MLIKALAGIGCFASLRFCYNILSSFFLSKQNSYDINKLKGSWAVITGASDGIGAEYAKNLGSRGFNLLLLSRTESKLNNIALEVQNINPNIIIQTIPIDFSKEYYYNSNIYKDIENTILGKEQIGILVNNVGMNYSYPKLFNKTNIKDDDNIINVNIKTTNYLTKLILPKMIEKNSGVIINVSSLTCKMPTPMLTVYSSTKAYIEQFSKSLQEEVRKDGIIIQCCTPGLVETRMSKTKASWSVCTPKTIVDNSLTSLNPSKIIVIPYYAHRIMNLVTSFIPENIISKQMLSFNKKISDKAERIELLKEKRKRKQN